MRPPKSSALCLLAAVAMLQACALPAHGRQRKEPDAQNRLFVPWANLALDVELPGLAANLWDSSEEALRRAGAAGNPNADAGRVREFQGFFMPPKRDAKRIGFLRIRMEPVRAGVTAEGLRAGSAEHYPKAARVDRGSVRQYEYKQTPLLRFNINGPSPHEGAFLGYVGGGTAFPIPYGAPGLPSTYQVLEGYVVRDGTGFLFRYSSPRIKDDDEQRFYAVLDSVRFVDTSKPASAYDHFTLGRDLYRREEHRAAVGALAAAFALEQKGRELPQAQWRDLLMTFANALGATDDVERARDVLEYGAAAEPAYPYFHHGLSRLHAHLGDLDRTLSELEKAYQLAPKAKGAPGGRIPDPLEDPIYRRFAGDARFRDGVRTLQKKYKH